MLPDLGDAQGARASVDGKQERIAGLQSQAARRQCERGALARGPGLEQPNLGHTSGLLGLQDEREIGHGSAPAVADEPARFLRCRRVARCGSDIRELGGGRQVRLLGAGERGQALAGPALNQQIGRQLGSGQLRTAMLEDDTAPALARVDEERQLEGLQRLPRESTRSMTKPANTPVSRDASCSGKP